MEFFESIEEIEKQIEATRNRLEMLEDDVTRSQCLGRLRYVYPWHPVLLARNLFILMTLFGIGASVFVGVAPFADPDVAESLQAIDKVLGFPLLFALIGVAVVMAGAWLLSSQVAVMIGRDCPLLPWEKKERERLSTDLSRLTRQRQLMERVKGTPMGARPRLLTPVPLTRSTSATHHVVGPPAGRSGATPTPSYSNPGAPSRATPAAMSGYAHPALSRGSTPAPTGPAGRTGPGNVPGVPVSPSGYTAPADVQGAMPTTRGGTPLGAPPRMGTPVGGWARGVSPATGHGQAASSINPPTGGMNPPTGGMRPPTGGMLPGQRGMNPPTGGMRPPTGGMNPATGGMNPPTSGQRLPPGVRSATPRPATAHGQIPPPPIGPPLDPVLADGLGPIETATEQFSDAFSDVQEGAAMPTGQLIEDTEQDVPAFSDEEVPDYVVGPPQESPRLDTEEVDRFSRPHTTQMPAFSEVQEEWLIDAIEKAGILANAFPVQAKLDFNQAPGLPFTLVLERATPAMAVRAMMAFVEFLASIAVPPKARVELISVRHLDRSFHRNIQAALEPYFAGKADVIRQKDYIDIVFTEPDPRWNQYPYLPSAE